MNRNNTVLYTGVTNNLERRMWEHKSKYSSGFTSKYNVNKLVYYEVFPNAENAIMAEKKIKGWTRAKKMVLILKDNPKLTDLSGDSSGAKAPSE